LTSREDWLFRAEHLRQQAQQFERQARDLNLQATEFYLLSNRAKQIADEMESDQKLLLEQIGPLAFGNQVLVD
jgi:hypothetical protein